MIDEDEEEHEHEHENGASCGGYFEDFDDYYDARPDDELTKLSRQSMMPIHELIAYYQYIQQGSSSSADGSIKSATSIRSVASNERNSSVSRHSSNASHRSRTETSKSGANDEANDEASSTSPSSDKCHKVSSTTSKLIHTIDTGKHESIGDRIKDFERLSSREKTCSPPNKDQGQPAIKSTIIKVKVPQVKVESVEQPSTAIDQENQLENPPIVRKISITRERDDASEPPVKKTQQAPIEKHTHVHSTTTARPSLPPPPPPPRPPTLAPPPKQESPCQESPENNQTKPQTSTTDTPPSQTNATTTTPPPTITTTTIAPATPTTATLSVPTPVKDKRRVRANVVLELINSERDFVKHLKDVVEGYLYPARRHPEIFTNERINTIFANIEQLYEFQRKFLESLETCINWDDLAASQVGKCFLEYESGFSVYHYYCNNHPNATSELGDLFTKPRFVKFFEACRLLQNMIDISLDGFLLTPIQKICKYPLQLNELLKNTDKNHPDFEPVTSALDSMRNCANLANERKRRIEALADVMSFQERVDNWFGPKLSDTSSTLIHSGEVSKMNSPSWSQGVQLYLFDHLLLFAKKDLLKRNNIILKGRVCTDTISEVSDADEYKPKKSFKLFCSEQQRWFVFTTRSEKEKDDWLRAFERERSLVESDENEGFQITDREIGVARRTLQNRKHGRSARYQRAKRPDTTIVDHLDIDDANAIMNRTLSLPSCIHPSHVMNFVEDSRVVSGAKKSSSPNSSTRSPVDGGQYPSEHEGAPSGGSWFKKMGSKKLARSQVYNVNGSNGNGSAGTPSSGSLPMGSKPQPISPTSFIADTTTNNSAAKYDQLEKRHRDHMISEEQARLFRLNNDIPTSSTILGSPPMTSPPSQEQHGENGRRRKSGSKPTPPVRSSATRLNPSARSTGAITTPATRSSTTPPVRKVVTPESKPFFYVNSFKSLTLDPDPVVGEQPVDEMYGDQKNGNVMLGPSAGYEMTVVLSSGKVVKLREDSV